MFFLKKVMEKLWQSHKKSKLNSTFFSKICMNPEFRTLVSELEYHLHITHIFIAYETHWRDNLPVLTHTQARKLSNPCSVADPHSPTVHVPV